MKKEAPPPSQTAPNLNWIVSYIWGIADDILRNVYDPGKYRDIILPMILLRRLDVVLEPTKNKVLNAKRQMDEKKILNQKNRLQKAAGQAFYNASPFTMRVLSATASPRRLQADFEEYLKGFSNNVQDILKNFEIYNKIPRLVQSDRLLPLIERLTSPKINLSPAPVPAPNSKDLLPALDNHGMGTIFEELVRKFNEENNKEAGEHWTPRDAVRLMANLLFLPVAKTIKSSSYLLYDDACGTGGMLTVAEETLKQLAELDGKEVSMHLYGQEINRETYAICKADMLLKGKGESAEGIVGGPSFSTLSNDHFSDKKFDFMLANPPYGKSWNADLKIMGGKDGIEDERFFASHNREVLSFVTRSNDGQMLFLANKLAKMKNTPMGSRIVAVHNNSSLSTGNAGQGESNIRRYILENDWLEAIVALPANMFYNTGIATYIWVISNRKAEARKGKTQLINASQWFKRLRKSMGHKTCEVSDSDIKRICDVFIDFKETAESKIFPNSEFGYYDVTVDRPLRIVGAEGGRVYSAKEIKQMKKDGERAADAPPVICKICKNGERADPLRGKFATVVDGKNAVVEYATDTDLRENEKIPFLSGCVEKFLQKEVLPHAPDSWHDPAKDKIGYEINFNRYFYRPQKMRTLKEIHADIVALEKESEGILRKIIR